MRLLLLIFFYCAISTVNFLFSQELIVYNDIPGRSASDHYTVRVKFESESDDKWRDVFVLQTAAKEKANDPKDGYYDNLRGWTASWIAFESDFVNDNVIVEISKKNGSPITAAMVRPVADASAAVITNGKAYVTFTEPANVNVDINGQLENNYTGHGYNGPDLHTISLFANPLYRIPDSNNPNVKVLQPGEDINSLNRSEWDTLVFAPGVHNIGVAGAGDVNDVTPFQIFTNEVLFIPGDAVVHGTIHPKNTWGADASRFWTVYGSGTISGENIIRTPSDQLNKTTKPFTYQAEGARLEGFVVADPAFHTFNMGNSADNTSNRNIYENLKILAWRKNSDGINAFRHSEVRNCFFRVQDDAFYLGQKNVIQENNVVWNDANGAVLFLQNIVDGSTNIFRDVTVIYHRAYWHWWDGGRAVSMRQTPSGVSISNVHVEDILVEDPLPAFPPFHATMLNSSVNNVTLNNIVFENIHQEHDGVSTSGDNSQGGKPQNALIGEANAIWKNITFKNCYFNGKTLTSFEDGNFDTAFVDKNTVIFEIPSDPPVADFSANVTSIAKGEKVSFTDLSENSPTSWNWIFEGGTPATSTVENPAVTFATSGVFNVSLTATNSFGSNTITKEGYINVSDSVSVTGVSITNCPAGDLVIGKTMQLGATISPSNATDKRVSWTSSNESVLKVAPNGILTPTAAGSAIIIVTSTNGEFTDFCEITVVSINEIIMLSAPYQVWPGETISLNVDYIASEQRDLFAVFQMVKEPFTEYGTSRITVPAGELTKSMNLTISSTAPNGVNAYKIAVSILPVGGIWEDRFDEVSNTGVDIYPPPLSIESPSEVLNLYPNPADDLLSIEFKDKSKRTIRVFNMVGRLIHSTETNMETLQMDIKSLGVSGQLLIQIQSKSLISIYKVIVR